MRPPKTQPTTDARALAGDVAQTVLSTLFAHGVSVPLQAMAAAIAAVEERYGGGKKSNSQAALAPTETQQ